MFKCYLLKMSSLYLLLLSISFTAQAADISESKVNCPSGDAYFFQYLGPQDEQMRSEDYKNFYEPLKRLSSAGFCVHMNWAASIIDLKVALKNTRPTIIIWSSHGQPRGVTDKLDDETIFPPDIFKNVSSSVYQFVVATCYGSLAIKNYDLTAAKHIKFTGWDFPLSTDFFKKFLEKWDFLENYPKNRAHSGLICKEQQGQHHLVTEKGGRIVSVLNDQESCFANWASASEGLVCSQIKNVRKLFDIRTGQLVENSKFEIYEEWCLETPERAYNGRVCYMAEKKASVYRGKQYYEMFYGIYDLKKHSSLAGKEFNTKEDCVKFLWSNSN